MINFAELPVLKTPRLILRPMTVEDSELVVSWRNSEHISSMSKESRNAKLVLEDHISWFTRTRNERIDYIIEAMNTSLPVGSMSLKHVKLHPGCKCAEMGKYIGEKSALGKGYASEATYRWIRFAFEFLELEQIVAVTRADNQANIRVNKKAGLEAGPMPSNVEYDDRIWVFMSLTRKKWAEINE